MVLGQQAVGMAKSHFVARAQPSIQHDVGGDQEPSSPDGAPDTSNARTLDELFMAETGPVGRFCEVHSYG
jgi:hypothetical protein